MRYKKILRNGKKSSKSEQTKKLSEEAEIANMTPEELNLYDISLKNFLNKMTAEDIVKAYQKEIGKLHGNYSKLESKYSKLESSNYKLESENAELRRKLELNGASRITSVRTRSRAKVTV